MIQLLTKWSLFPGKTEAGVRTATRQKTCTDIKTTKEANIDTETNDQEMIDMTIDHVTIDHVTIGCGTIDPEMTDRMTTDHVTLGIRAITKESTGNETKTGIGGISIIQVISNEAKTRTRGSHQAVRKTAKI